MKMGVKLMPNLIKVTSHFRKIRANLTKRCAKVMQKVVLAPQAFNLVVWVRTSRFWLSSVYDARVDPT